MFTSKKWIFLVLTSFLLLLVPRDLWHTCIHTEPTEKSIKSQHQIDQGDCPICDFHAYTQALPPSFSIVFYKACIYFYQLPSPINVHVEKAHSFLRGPPIF